MIRPYMWDIFRFRSNFSGAAIQEYGVFFFRFWGWAGERRGTRSRCSNSAYHDLGLLLTSGLSLVFFVHVSKWVSILMLKICYY